jgi:hypothetical protein
MFGLPDFELLLSHPQKKGHCNLRCATKTVIRSYHSKLGQDLRVHRIHSFGSFIDLPQLLLDLDQDEDGMF